MLENLKNLFCSQSFEITKVHKEFFCNFFFSTVKLNLKLESCLTSNFFLNENCVNSIFCTSQALQLEMPNLKNFVFSFYHRVSTFWPFPRDSFINKLKRNDIC